MKYFYARVSTREQNLDRQLEVAKELGIENVYADKASGKNFDRTEYKKLKAVLKGGDELYIKELDRLGRNLEMIKSEIKEMQERGVILRILDIPTTMINIDGQDWVMRMINNILVEVIGNIAEQERKKTKKRQAEGIACMERNSEGKIIGYGKPKIEINGPLQYEGETIRQACERLNISRSTWYRAKNKTA